MFINALMLPQFDYLDIIWCKTSKTNLKSLDVLYKKVAKIALDMNTREASIKVYCTMKWLPLHLRRQLHLSTYMYKILNNITPTTFLNKFVYVTGTSRNAGKCNLFIPTSRSHKTLSYLGAKCWNALIQCINSPIYWSTIFLMQLAMTNITQLIMALINSISYLTKTNNPNYQYDNYKVHGYSLSPEPVVTRLISPEVLQAY